MRLQAYTSFRLLFISLFAVAAIAFYETKSPQTVQAVGSTTIVISEFRFRGAGGASDEFIEIRNIANYPVNIGGYQLRGSNNTAGVSVRATVPFGKVLNAGCTYLFVNSAGNATLVSLADQTYGTGFTDDGGVAISTGSTTPVILDQVGLSTGSAYKEGTVLAAIFASNPNNVTYERLPFGSNTTDTDNNANDFAQQSTQNPTTSFGCSYTATYPKIADFDADAKSDVSVWRSDERNWYIYQSSLGNALTVKIDWGSSALGDKAVPGDYDGDGKTDFAVYRPSEGNWYIINSSTNTITVKGWGDANDKPVPGDYDGDGKTDIAIFRPSEGNWYIIRSSSSAVTITSWGASSDIPVPGDYDGDRRTDIAVFRPTEGNWYVLNSNAGTVTVRGWGTSSDTLVPADYDGDGKTDFAVYRSSEGNWYIRQSSNNTTVVRNWGASDDKAVPADYDGDSKADVAVYRPTEGNWYILNSSGGMTLLNLLGNTPVPNAYLPQ
ncbi:MAG: VCBS repeat-containing protein [Pyrinomonadaceae bacterium]|nr:VCBS repeat-containing protein [Pyrinomonadaceae bacterium]